MFSPKIFIIVTVIGGLLCWWWHYAQAPDANFYKNAIMVSAEMTNCTARTYNTVGSEGKVEPQTEYSAVLVYADKTGNTYKKNVTGEGTCLGAHRFK